MHAMPCWHDVDLGDLPILRGGKYVDRLRE